MARYYASTNSSNWGMFYDVSEGSYNINNNTSPVYVSIYLYRPSSASYYGGTADISFTLNGETKSTSAYPSYPTNIGVGEGNAHLMASFSYTVGHNSDGSKSVSFSLSWSANFSPTSASGSGSMTLATIPRASEISSMSNVYIGENTTINVNRKSSSFTHTITYSFGSLSGTVVTKSASTGVSWTIPESFYSQMTNTTQKNVTLYITTYSGNSQIGDRKSTTFTLRTRESVCKPDIDATIKDVNEDILALTGDETIFVGGYSIAEVDYEATAKKNASIVAVKVNTDTAISNPYEYNVGANDTSIKVTAYDSRSYSSTKEFVAGTDYTFINYIQPTTNVTVKRKAPTSDEMSISFSGNYFNDTFGDVANVLTLSWKYREYKTYNPDNWTTGGTLVLGTDYVLKGNSYHSGDNTDYEEEISLGHLFDYRKNYEIQFIYSDKLSNGSVVSLGIKGIPIVNWSDDFFNVNGDIRQYNKSILQPNACKMVTNDRMSIAESQSTKITVFQEEFEFGDYECDVINNRLVVRNTTLCQLSGAFGGNGFAWARINVYEQVSNTNLYSLGTLVQPAGNKFHLSPLQTQDIVLDPTKAYYVELYVSGYNEAFTLNSGFATDVTWISARKIY